MVKKQSILKKYFVLVIIIVLLLALPTGIEIINNRQKAIISLEVPDSYEIGELIVLDASKSKADTLIWKIIPESPNFKIEDKIAFFSSIKPIDYTIVVVAQNNRDLSCQVYNLNYSKKIINLTTFELEVKSWLDPSNQKTDALKIAQGYKNIARLIETDILTTVDDIVSATSRVTTDALGNNLDVWRPFIVNFQNYLETNPPITVKDHILVWRNLAKALEKIFSK